MPLRTTTDPHITRTASSQQLDHFHRKSATTAMLHTLANANTALLRGLPLSPKTFDFSKFIFHPSFECSENHVNTAALAANGAEHQQATATDRAPMDNVLPRSLDDGSQVSGIKESIHFPSCDAKSIDDMHHQFMTKEAEYCSNSSSSSRSGSTGRTSPVSDRDLSKAHVVNAGIQDQTIEDWLGEVGDGYESDVTTIGPSVERVHHEKMEAAPRQNDENEDDECQDPKERHIVIRGVNAVIQNQGEDSEDEENAFPTITAMPNVLMQDGARIYRPDTTPSFMSGIEAGPLFPNGFTTYPVVLPPYHQTFAHEYRPNRVGSIMKYAQPGRIQTEEAPNRSKFGRVNGRVPWVFEWEPQEDQEVEPPRSVLKKVLSRPRSKVTASTTVQPGPVVRAKPPSTQLSRLMARLDEIDKKRSAPREDSGAFRAPGGPNKEKLVKSVEKHQIAGKVERPLVKDQLRSTMANAPSVAPKASQDAVAIAGTQKKVHFEFGTDTETMFGLPPSVTIRKKARTIKVGAERKESSKPQKAKRVSKPASVQKEEVSPPVFRSLDTPTITNSSNVEKQRQPPKKPTQLPEDTTTKSAKPPPTTDWSQDEKWLRLTTIALDKGVSDPQLDEYFGKKMNLRAGTPDTDYDRTMTGSMLLKYPLETFVLLLLVFIAGWLLFYYLELV
ncbi:uncharacterized protein BDZ99DRAFT_523779 [Mytilinidion resinicola]|uniref:Uncharacterized protein n=1 Tax=Mytilinidion resinicola TaxID=574789 RepID=A0A6A6YCL9_9PEZI|nr:uncharacterized protein BDZ99DRAFT_523779 [Mytilinidion resinicola]KAF2806318.1 hypothetical protein BDZ99DRAFT_523779 [Mytilinidion resinicola]